MALQELQFSFPPTGVRTIPAGWSHTGVVGSGDMEVLMRYEKLNGSVNIKVRTPVKGFDEVWKKVLGRFVFETGLTDAYIEINDNNATPFIVALRMKQALSEALGGTE